MLSVAALSAQAVLTLYMYMQAKQRTASSFFTRLPFATIFPLLNIIAYYFCLHSGIQTELGRFRFF